MIYSVIPRELEAELLEPLSAHYADSPEVTVIVDRRQGERRHRGSAAPASQQRVLRDRRRRRVTGEFATLQGEGDQLATA
ncbi:MAG TPA: hypothetical protein VKS25_10345 [Solirubrobacteraceae bacterium]|nr:hypothetical protein [Solirubrobacteraceae bacterium]